MSIYRRPYYERWYLEEHAAYRAGRLRKEDMLSAILFALLDSADIRSLHDWTDLAGRFDLDRLCDPRHVAEALHVRCTRRPQQVLDIGCGRGECLAAFNSLRIPVTAIDPSPAAVEYSRETLAAWCDTVAPTTRLECEGLEDLRADQLSRSADVVLFLESIEHVERTIVRQWFMEEIRARASGLVTPDCRIVVANIWFPVWSPPDHLWGVGRSPASGDDNRRLGRRYWWKEYDMLAHLGGLDIIFRSPTNPIVVFERRKDE